MEESKQAIAPNRRYLTGGLCSVVFAYGMVVALLGVVEKPLGDALGVGPKETGYFASFINVAQIIMLFLVGFIIDRFGKKPVITIGCLLIGLSMLLLPFPNSYAAVCVLFVLLGLGGAGANGGGNAMINDLYPENPSRALNLVNTFFGIGAIFLPFIGAALIATLGLKSLMFLAFLLSMIPVVMLGFGKFPAPIVGEKFSFSDAKKVITDPLVKRLAVVLFFYLALEISTGMWCRRFFEDHYQIEAQAALFYLAGYWTLLLIGRIIAGKLLLTVSGPRLLLFAGFGACIGLLILVLSPNSTVAVIGLFIAGLFYAPMFPTTLGTAGDHFKEYIGTIFGLIIAVGVLGMVVLPVIIGWTWDSGWGYNAVWWLFIFAVLMTISQGFVFSQVKKRSQAQA